MANYNYINDLDDEMIDLDNNQNADNEQNKSKGFINWCKRHKKALILGGITVTVTAVGIYIYKKGKKLKIDNNFKFIDVASGDTDTIDKELRDMFNFDIPADAVPTNAEKIASEAVYNKKYDWIPDGFKAADDALVWWVADGELNSSVIPSEVGSEAAKVVDAVADKIAKIFEQVDVDDVQCINMMMSLK